MIKLKNHKLLRFWPYLVCKSHIACRGSPPSRYVNDAGVRHGSHWVTWISNGCREFKSWLTSIISSQHTKKYKWEVKMVWSFFGKETMKVTFQIMRISITNIVNQNKKSRIMLPPSCNSLLHLVYTFPFSSNTFHGGHWHTMASNQRL